LAGAQNILLKNSALNKEFEAISQMLERASIEVSEAISELQKQADDVGESSDNLKPGRAAFSPFVMPP